MPPDSLPDDPAHWPSDPHELLGMGETFDVKSLRRAYARLIRRFNPEEFPEQFRRIREAYDSLMRYAEWFEQADIRFTVVPEREDDNSLEDEPAHNLETTDEPPVDDASRMGRFLVPESSPPADAQLDPVATLRRDIDDCWRTGAEIEDRSAYLRLLELHQAHPGNIDICVRLYWLLRIDATFDEFRKPVDWLMHGLTYQSGSPLLIRLYLLELDREPLESVQDRCAALIHATWQDHWILSLLQKRWDASGWLKVRHLIGRDLKNFKDLVERRGRNIWLRLIFMAVEHFTWRTDQSSREGLQFCRRELHDMSDIYFAFEREWDQYELLMEQAECQFDLPLFAETPISDSLIDLVFAMQNEPRGRLRQRILSLLQEWKSDLVEALFMLDKMSGRSMIALAELSQFIDAMYESPPMQALEQSESARSYAIHFIQQNYSEEYGLFRPTLLSFCIRECIPPEFICELQIPGIHSPAWHLTKKNLAGDRVFQCIYRGCVSFSFVIA